MKHLVTIPHTKEECLHALDTFSEAGLLERAEFGCGDGDHTAYLFVDAEHRSEALAQLPEELQHKAKAVALSKYTPEQLREFHAVPDAAQEAGTLP